jgi:hypothetical protein
MMQVRTKARRRLFAGVAVLSGAAAVFACSNETGFQPLASGAKQWDPPAGWDPFDCATGNYVAITSCPGCTGISYALCDGNRFTQCVCGGPVWPGATCPQALDCSSVDFPPPNWTEYTDYTGPGWAGLDVDSGGGNVDSGGGEDSGAGEDSGGGESDGGDGGD